jgi:hypothetical protein
MIESQDSIKRSCYIGYGTRKKIDNTTAITSLKAEEFLNESFSSHSRKSCRCTSSIIRFARSAPSVIIRGLGTALGGTPLYIVMDAHRISIILIPMITSYEILKDASALLFMVLELPMG